MVSAFLIHNKIFRMEQEPQKKFKSTTGAPVGVRKNIQTLDPK